MRERRSKRTVTENAASISIIRPRTPPCFPLFSTATLRRFPAIRFLSIAVAAAGRQNPNYAARELQQPNKNLLKARRTVDKSFSILAPVLSFDENPQLSHHQAVGFVAAAQANFMSVIVESAASDYAEEQRRGVELLCVVKAVLKKIKRRILVGDKVLVGGIDWVDRRGMIEDVFQRKSEILDPPVTNVDHLMVLFSMDQPKIDLLSLTRFLVEAESTGIPLTLALNKSELVDEESLETWKIRLRKWGYEPIFCSVETKYGLDTVQSTLREQTSVIVGPSGIGKSSLINALRSNKRVLGAAEILGSKWFEDQRVGEVSTKSGKGKHTTRNVTLLPLAEGGYLADTPGFSHPSLMKVTKQSLAQHFPEIRRILSDSEPIKCSFSDCLHLGERGCIVNVDWER